MVDIWPRKASSEIHICVREMSSQQKLFTYDLGFLFETFVDIGVTWREESGGILGKLYLAHIELHVLFPQFCIF